MSADRPIVVVGSGVIGLTTAVALLERGHRVEIVTRAESPSTTSDVAAAFWYPYRAGSAPRTLEWARLSYERFRELSLDGDAGVTRREVRQLTAAERPDRALAGIVEGFSELAPTDLPPGSRWRSGSTFVSYVAETPRYMPWLRRRVDALGGRVLQRTVSALAELLPGAAGVIDCAGIAARELAQDPLVRPIRGQVLRVRRDRSMPEEIVDSVDEDFIAYIVPRRDDVILGGTAIEDDWSVEPSAEATREIIERCRAIWPRLAHPEVLEVKVGLRPGRPEVRLALERSHDRWLAHNYGHGGAGFTLSWGCAAEVAALVEAAGRAPSA
ncbi:MAG TPA: FAD-dependent oxidoreductase [Phycisphaerales bacterium]|nr:FAD-dependent oxidoreductase [Phycisphaerales bacterium]HMP36891.1 FAD-dependent oxidoreductase [Phycisphaerales bacterium]